MSSALSRLAVAGILLAGLSCGSSASAAGCGRSPAREAFDIQGLKSELMVTALTCKAQDRYNDFVAKFRSSLLDGEQRLNTYFRSTYGKSSQREHDDYITQLANVQSEHGVQSGTILCAQRMGMFDEVTALDTEHDLASYAEAKDITQPASFESCESPAASKKATVRRTRRRVKRA